MSSLRSPPLAHTLSPWRCEITQLSGLDFAILALRQFFKTDYRGIVQLLADLSDLRKALHLKKVPHYSTLCCAEGRLLKGGLSSRFFELFSAEPLLAA